MSKISQYEVRINPLLLSGRFRTCCIKTTLRQNLHPVKPILILLPLSWPDGFTVSKSPWQILLSHRYSNTCCLVPQQCRTAYQYKFANGWRKERPCFFVTARNPRGYFSILSQFTDLMLHGTVLTLSVCVHLEGRTNSCYYHRPQSAGKDSIDRCTAVNNHRDIHTTCCLCIPPLLLPYLP